MWRFPWKYLACACSALILPPVGATPRHAFPQTAVIARSSLHTHNGGSRICFDEIFYGPMPGQTNYCLGLRAWSYGHYHASLEFLKLAAGWGNKDAQYTLGLIYYNGHYVPANHALGLAWLKLADQRHNDPQIEQVTNSVIELATPAQRQQANLLYQQMRETYGDKVATARAWHHLRHWQRSHSLLNVMGCVFLYGREAHMALVTGVGVQVPSPTGPGFLVCVHLHNRRRLVQRSVDRYFQGWIDNVTVGPLQAVPASAASSGHPD